MKIGYARVSSNNQDLELQKEELLNEKKVDLISLDSGDRVDTTSPMGKAFFQIAGVFAELERGMINARTRAGVAKARADGVKFGRKVGSKNRSTAIKIEKIKIFLGETEALPS